MALTKMVNGVSVALTDLEEKAELLRWKVGDHDALKPQKPSQQDEHETLINEGADAVKAKRAEFAAKLAAWEAEHKPLVDAHLAAHAEYLKSIGAA